MNKTQVWDKFFQLLVKYRLSVLMFFVLTLIPFSLNLYALSLDVGQAAFRKLVDGSYMCWWGFECNPLPEIIRSLLVFSFALSLFVQLSVVLLSKLLSSKLPNYLKYLFVILIVFGAGKIVEIASGRLMPIIWLSLLHNYNFGFPVSIYAVTYSLYVVFPVSIFGILLSIFIRAREANKQH